MKKTVLAGICLVHDILHMKGNENIFGVTLVAITSKTHDENDFLDENPTQILKSGKSHFNS